MIQRIQSLLLFAAFLLDLAVFFNPVYAHSLDDPQQWIGLGFALILTAAMLMSAVSIFLYKNRKNQMKWVRRAMVLQLISIGWSLGILFSLGGFGTFLWDETLGVVLLILGLVAQILAHRNIKSDEELVQSMDRIR